VCGASEDCSTCPQDCGACTGCQPKPTGGCGGCGCESCVCQKDAYCCQTRWDDLCVAECQQCGQACNVACGNGACESQYGETCTSCPADCGPCADTCGDHVCGPTESCASCPADCGSCCGNHLCDHGETCRTCPGDCGACCGNHVCEATLGETCASCPQDCGTCG
jgi:hypothetical protein